MTRAAAKKRSPFQTKLDRDLAKSVPAGERTSAEEYDLAMEQYERDLALYEHEQRRWREVWLAAGKEPPPTQQIKPEPPKKPAGIDCEECEGTGYVECSECGHESECPECDGSGEAE